MCGQYVVQYVFDDQVGVVDDVIESYELVFGKCWFIVKIKCQVMVQLLLMRMFLFVIMVVCGLVRQVIRCVILLGWVNWFMGMCVCIVMFIVLVQVCLFSLVFIIVGEMVLVVMLWCVYFSVSMCVSVISLVLLVQQVVCCFSVIMLVCEVRLMMCLFCWCCISGNIVCVSRKGVFRLMVMVWFQLVQVVDLVFCNKVILVLLISMLMCLQCCLIWVMVWLMVVLLQILSIRFRCVWFGLSCWVSCSMVLLWFISISWVLQCVSSWLVVSLMLVVVFVIRVMCLEKLCGCVIVLVDRVVFIF